MLRKHQQQFKNVIDGIMAGSKVNTIYCHCTPGSGKSLLPVLAGRLIETGLADKLMWTAPRLSLLDQGEREFVNPMWRKEFNHHINVRSSTNENNPCRGLQGFCTTYQAVGMDEGILRNEFLQRRYILILDEGHHIAADSLWEKKIKELWGAATYRIFLSGTLERGDDSRIAFVPYREDGKSVIPALQDGPDAAVIRYTRADALEEKAIIPLTFHLSDGSAEWEDTRGRKVRVASIDKMDEVDANKALYTALKTEYADDLLVQGIAHWQEHRKHYTGAKCLVVTSNISEAKRHMRNLSGISARCAIATSEDSAAALKVINKMKSGKLDVIVTVAMAYEGLSIPEISHIICLTRIRSVPWIEQMTARSNRIDPAYPYDEQTGHIFAPADPLFKRVMKQIEKEQLPVMEFRNKTSRQFSSCEDAGDGGFRLEPSPGGITPLSSALTGKREMILGQRELPFTPGKTSSEIETELLEQIEDHIRSYSFQNRFNPKRINGEIFNHFGGKPRRQMTIPELEKCLAHVRETYPLSFVRGSGHRVAAKATPLNVEWR
ncbi:MAG: DEAD/DEAH box helicase family protein [Deltaproteobacteria bacterium]|nr:DEAD/DEAH box helicase family protein [Deltaproteobacteria bacterium]